MHVCVYNVCMHICTHTTYTVTEHHRREMSRSTAKILKKYSQKFDVQQFDYTIEN